jgi:hypothetical protein
MLGYKNVRNLFESVADRNPEDIISHLKSEGVKWLDGNKPDDDITFVVIQVEK